MRFLRRSLGEGLLHSQVRASGCDPKNYGEGANETGGVGEDILGCIHFWFLHVAPAVMELNKASYIHSAGY